MTNHLNFVFLGLGNGAVFAALAIALVVTYRSSGVLNFGTGALSLHAAYTYALLRQGEVLIPIPGVPDPNLSSPLGLWPAILITVAFEAVIGILLYVLVFRPLRNHLAVAKAVASLGVMIVFTGIINQQVGGDQILVSPILPRHTWEFGDLRILSDRVLFVAIIVAIAAILAAVYRFTRFGVATRAAAETEFGALVSGLSPDRIALINWAVSAVVAAIARILIAPLVPLVPGTYTLFIVPALAAAVLGRFSALAPVVIGGIGIGALQSESVYLQSRYDWFPSSGVAELIPLLIVLAVLVIRGRPLPTRGMLIEHTLGRAPRPHSTWKPAVVLVPIAVVAVYLANDSYRSALIESFIMGIIALSLVVVTGYVGQISLAQLTLAGAAGFLLSTLGHSWGIPFPISPILAALGATAVGVLAGLPALRIRGMLVAVVTLTLSVALEAIWFRNNDLNGGTGGAQISNPELFGLNLGIGTGRAFPRPEFALLCLTLLTLTAMGVAWLRRSKLGSAMLAVRADERSAAAAGISVTRVKLLGFGIGSFIAGIGGCLIAYKQTNVTFTAFDALAGLGLFTIVFLAGITSVAGGLLAGFLTVGGVGGVFLSHTINLGQWYGIASGIGLILAVIGSPDGIVGPSQRLAERRRRRGRTAAAPESTPVARPAAPAAPGSAGPDRPDPLPVPDPLSRPDPLSGPTAPDPDLSPPAPSTPARSNLPAHAGATAPAVHLSLAAVGVVYGGVTALADISLDVPPGSIVGVIGPNGAGKTTMMDATCGFAAAAGQITLAGQRLDGLRPHRRARLGLARTFQGLDLYEDLSVEENLMAGQHAARPGAPGLDEILRSLDLWELRGQEVSELSQGHRQLVSIARALASGPDLLLLDEPAAGLGATESAWLADRLRAVRARGVTIVLVDHDMRFVLGLCDVIHVLDFGRQIASGSPAEIRTNPAVAQAYLGTSHADREMAT